MFFRNVQMRYGLSIKPRKGLYRSAWENKWIRIFPAPLPIRSIISEHAHTHSLTTICWGSDLNHASMHDLQLHLLCSAHLAVPASRGLGETSKPSDWHRSAEESSVQTTLMPLNRNRTKLPSFLQTLVQVHNKKIRPGIRPAKTNLLFSK